MYYWHAIFWDNGLRLEHNFWADNYDAAKVELRKMHGAGINIVLIERIR